MRWVPSGFLLWIITTLALLTALIPGARAEEPATAEDLRRALESRDEIIRNLLERVEALEREVQRLRAAPSSSVSAAEAPPPGPTTPASPSPEEDEEERLARAALERTLIQRGGLLLPPRTVEVEPSFSYVHSSSDRISIDGFTILPILVVGDIVSERVRRDRLTAALTVRLGVARDFQAEARIPYVYDLERVVTADDRELTRDDTGLGDVEFALSHQLLRERGWIPDVLASVRWKTTTGNDPFDSGADGLADGTGFHGLQGTLTAVKVRDPVVFFWGLSYTANLPDTKSIGRVDPGDTWGFNAGLALALNLETSVNVGWEQRFTNETSVDGHDVSGSYLTVGNLRLGATYVLSPHMSLDVGVVIGLTADAPDVEVITALPYRFSF